jgi:multidrug transporter EmrE-like cation transporter
MVVVVAEGSSRWVSLLSGTPPMVFVAVAVVLGAFGQLCLKLGANQIKVLLAGATPASGGAMALLGQWATYSSLWPLWLGLGLYALGAVLWVWALGRVELSLAYPMLSFGYVIVTVLAHFMLGESLGPWKLGGLATICLGIWVLSRGA